MSEKNNRILVVDDKEDIVETVSFCLTQEGFEVVAAFDGQQALEVARREQPDLIVLDVMLPKENGYQVARFLREDWQEGRLPKMPAILMLTARTVFDAQREEFLQTWSGADVFMYKPFDLDELTVRVKSLLPALESKAEV
ncbi:MAG TPA: response regulator [Vicinamibacteria bacterium]|nr:response regulator [Vicinamibacteria bacterium]